MGATMVSTISGDPESISGGLEPDFHPNPVRKSIPELQNQTSNLRKSIPGHVHKPPHAQTNYFALMVLLDNSTRWKSTYLSIQRALLIKKPINIFCFTHQDVLENNCLSAEDWSHLNDVAHGLQPFHMATGRLEGRATNGRHGAIWEALPVLTYLIGKV